MSEKKGACNEARISEEEDVGMRNSKRKGDFEHTKEELPKYGRKGDAENLNDETKENISEEEDIGKRKCRRKVQLINSMRK